MDYPTYWCKGWQIDSNLAESACKVVGNRLKRTDMRWRPNGSNAVGHLTYIRFSSATTTNRTPSAINPPPETLPTQNSLTRLIILHGFGLMRVGGVAGV